ncbi:MAG: hypothetical protein V9G12_19605 [Microthrixaceae bacterium]
MACPSVGDDHLDLGGRRHVAVEDQPRQALRGVAVRGEEVRSQTVIDCHGDLGVAALGHGDLGAIRQAADLDALEADPAVDQQRPLGLTVDV